MVMPQGHRYFLRSNMSSRGRKRNFYSSGWKRRHNSKVYSQKIAHVPPSVPKTGNHGQILFFSFIHQLETSTFSIDKQKVYFSLFKQNIKFPLWMLWLWVFRWTAHMFTCFHQVIWFCLQIEFHYSTESKTLRDWDKKYQNMTAGRLNKT